MTRDLEDQGLIASELGSGSLPVNEDDVLLEYSISYAYNWILILLCTY
jgi:phosphopantetheinyl transferase